MVPKQAEIVIAGGGVVGASLAYFLAKEGRDVVLIDRGNMGGEASSANGAWAWTASRRPGIDIRLALHSIQVIQSLGFELKRNFEYKPGGGLLVVTDENQLEPVRVHLEQRAGDGYPLKMLNAAETRELEPHLSETVLGAALSNTSGWLNPIFFGGGPGGRSPQTRGQGLLSYPVAGCGGQKRPGEKRCYR